MTPQPPAFTAFPIPLTLRYDGEMGDAEFRVALFTDMELASPAYSATIAIRVDRLTPATLRCKLAAKRAEYRATPLSPL